MVKVDFKPNLSGVRASLKQSGVCAALGRSAAGIASSLGDGYTSTVNIHNMTAVGRVWTDTNEAREDEARKHRMEPYCDRSYKG